MMTLQRGLYRHFKGNEYEVLEIAEHSEAQKCLVICRLLYEEGQLWARSLDMFSEDVEVGEKKCRAFTA
jgi:hypothetical protein